MSQSENDYVNAQQERYDAMSTKEVADNLLPFAAKLTYTAETKQEIEEALSVVVAGRRLDKLAREEQFDTTPLNDRAKATVLHALDLYIASGCEIPEGCTHFEGVEDGAPSREETEDLIELIENSDYVGVIDDLYEDEEDAAEAAETEPQTQATAETETTEEEHPIFSASGAKAMIEAFTGKPLDADTANSLVDKFIASMKAKGHTNAEEMGEFVRKGLLSKLESVSHKSSEDFLNDFKKRAVTEKYGAYTTGTVAQCLHEYELALRSGWGGMTPAEIDAEVKKQTEILTSMLPRTAATEDGFNKSKEVGRKLAEALAGAPHDKATLVAEAVSVLTGGKKLTPEIIDQQVALFKKDFIFNVKNRTGKYAGAKLEEAESSAEGLRKLLTSKL